MRGLQEKPALLLVKSSKRCIFPVHFRVRLTVHVHDFRFCIVTSIHVGRYFVWRSVEAEADPLKDCSGDMKALLVEQFIVSPESFEKACVFLSVSV